MSEQEYTPEQLAALDRAYGLDKEVTDPKRAGILRAVEIVSEARRFDPDSYVMDHHPRGDWLDRDALLAALRAELGEEA